MEDNKKIKILWPKFSAHSVVMNFVNALLERHPDIELIGIVSEKARINNDKIKVVYVKKIKKLFPLKGIRQIPGLGNIVKRVNPDLIISAPYYSLISFWSYFFAKKNNSKFILLPKDKHKKTLVRKILFPMWDITAGRKMLNYASAVPACTRDSEEFIKEIIKDKQKVSYIPPGININKFYPKKERRYAPNNDLRLLMVARMKAYKNHLVLLRALKYLVEEKNYSHFKLSLLGRGLLEEDIREKVKEYGLGDKVKFLERIPHEEIVNLYNQCDVLIFPSRDEIVGMVVPEAMACGTPVIASDTVGSRDHIINGENGLISKTGDYIDLANKILKISEMDIEKMGKSASEHIRKNYNAEKVADDFYNILKSS